MKRQGFHFCDHASLITGAKVQTKHFSLIHSDLFIRNAPLCPASFGESVDKKSLGKWLEFQARTLPTDRTSAIPKKPVDVHSDTSGLKTNNGDQQRQQFLVGYACYHWGYPSSPDGICLHTREGYDSCFQVELSPRILLETKMQIAPLRMPC